MLLKQKIKQIISPILMPLVRIYLRTEKEYFYKGIKIKVLPGVFHPGLFFSTRILLEYLAGSNLSGKRVLELGAGCGLISVYAAQRGAIVTASDISHKAIENLHVNADLNKADLKIIHSDLFNCIDKYAFDLIIINPPYFPKEPLNMEEYAWYCGNDFLYFRKLFSQLKDLSITQTKIVMILSEDCNIDQIKNIASDNGLNFQLICSKKNWLEENYLYAIK